MCLFLLLGYTIRVVIVFVGMGYCVVLGWVLLVKGLCYGLPYLVGWWFVR